MDLDLFVLVVISTLIFELVDGDVIETVKCAVIKKSRQMSNILAEKIKKWTGKKQILDDKRQGKKDDDNNVELKNELLAKIIDEYQLIEKQLNDETMKYRMLTEKLANARAAMSTVIVVRPHDRRVAIPLPWPFVKRNDDGYVPVPAPPSQPKFPESGPDHGTKAIPLPSPQNPIIELPADAAVDGAPLLLPSSARPRPLEPDNITATTLAVPPTQPTQPWKPIAADSRRPHSPPAPELLDRNPFNGIACAEVELSSESCSVSLAGADSGDTHVDLQPLPDASSYSMLLVLTGVVTLTMYCFFKTK